MSSRGRSGSIALLVSLATAAGLSACNDDGDDGDGDDAATGGVLVGGATASGGGSGRGGASPSGGTTSGGTTSGGGTGLATSSGGAGSTGGATAKGGSTASGGAAANAGRSGSMNGGVPGGNRDDSPYEIECHGDTVMCGDPTALLCLGIRVGTEVFGYSCSNECESEADCSDEPASGEAAAGCVEFVNKKYCLLVCKNGQEQASCPTGMYCYVYEGTPTGYCLWR